MSSKFALDLAETQVMQFKKIFTVSSNKFFYCVEKNFFFRFIMLRKAMAGTYGDPGGWGP